MRDFQPMKANFGLLPALEENTRGGKIERGRRHAESALAALETFLAGVPA
jgi:folate-dependent tRNA-U54 methylase TrmFO/GidA